jgi:catechol 2,3-dioxygenase-like lactoylglutathione lyase family enzyme
LRRDEEHDFLMNPITRRAALWLLGAAGGSRPSVAASTAGVIQAIRVDHVALDVGDVDKALSYYRRLFGNEVVKVSNSPGRYLRLGPCHLAIASAPAGQAPRINHLAVGVANFNAAAIRTALDAVGIKAAESEGELFVTDPDGNRIQICADQSWKLLNKAVPDKYPEQGRLFEAVGMHHIAVQVGDTSRAVEFYGKLFGKPIDEPGGNPQPLFLAGDTRLRIYTPAPGKPPRIDHFSALVENFDAPAVLKVIKSLGAKAELSKDGTLNEFYDPEGIRMQVTVRGQTPGSPPQK